MFYGVKVLSYCIRKTVFTASVFYSILSMPSIHTFLFILMIIAVHGLHVALENIQIWEDTNEELQHCFAALLSGFPQTPSENKSRNQA